MPPRGEKCERKGVRLLSTAAKNIVCNVYFYFVHQREMYEMTRLVDDSGCRCPICKIAMPVGANPWTSLPFKAAELAMNIPKRNIFRIAKRRDSSLEEYITPKRGTAPTFDERQQVRESISQVYDRKKPLHRGLKLGSNNEYADGRFGYVLESLGFVLQHWNHVVLPVEKLSLIAQRARYLRNVQDARRHNTLAFLDLCWIDEKYVVAHTPRDSKSLRTAVVFAASSAPETDPTFELVPPVADVRDALRSFVHSLTERLPTHSVLVIIDFSWMTEPAEEVPSDLSPKLEIVQWLAKHGIAHESSRSRYELLELVQEEKTNFCTPELQEIIESAGHSVLFLPSNVLELNPVTLVWEYIQRSLKKDSSADLRTLLGQIDKDIWAKFYLSTVDLEEAYRNADESMFHALERMPANTDPFRDDTCA